MQLAHGSVVDHCLVPAAVSLEVQEGSMCSSLHIKPSNGLPDVSTVLQLLPSHQAPVSEPDAPSSTVVVPPSSVLQQVRLNDGYTAVVFYKHDDASSTQLHGLPLNEFVASANLPVEAIWSNPAESQTFWTARLFVCFAATDCRLSIDQVGCFYNIEAAHHR